MASSAISICSNALQQLGDDPIASFSLSEGKRARLCGNLWPQVRDDILRKHPWPCARKMVTLAPESATPEFDWGYQFALPGDWLRTIQVGQRGELIPHEVLGRKIMADTNVLRLIYVYRNEDPALWDPSLCDLACAELVARLAYPITQSASLAQLKRQEAERAWMTAKAVAGMDNEPEDWGDHPFTDVRY